MTKEELQKIIAIDEGFRIELTTSKGDMDKFQETICAFANDMPGSGKKGYLLIGVQDNGQISGMKVDDALMKRISGIRSDGNILPLPVMTTEKVLRELMMNAVMHRDYQANMPTRLYQYDHHIEIMNPGGLYGQARPENFPHVNDYRNSVVAEMMKNLSYVNMFNHGVSEVQDLLKENQSPVAEFNVNLVTAFSVIVREPEAADTMQKDLDTMQKNMQKAMQKDPNTIQKAIQKALDERGISITNLQMDILVYFYLHPKATRNDYISSDENISEGGTKSNISRLQELELLKRKGGKKNGEWIVAIDLDFSNDVE